MQALSKLRQLSSVNGRMIDPPKKIGRPRKIETRFEPAAPPEQLSSGDINLAKKCAVLERCLQEALAAI